MPQVSDAASAQRVAADGVAEIEAHNVSKAYGAGKFAKTVIRDCSFAIEYLVSKAGTLAPQVYPVPRELDEQISRAKLEAMGMRIDKMTEEQAIYAKSWKAGT